MPGQTREKPCHLITQKQTNISTSIHINTDREQNEQMQTLKQLEYWAKYWYGSLPAQRRVRCTM